MRDAGSTSAGRRSAPGFAVTGLSAFGPDAPDLAAVKRVLSEGRVAIRPATADDIGFDPTPIMDPRPGLADHCSCLDGAWIGSGGPAPEPGDEDADVVLTWPLHLARQALADAEIRGAVLPDPSRIGLVCGVFSWGVSPGTRDNFLAGYFDQLDNPHLPQRPKGKMHPDPRLANRLADELGARLGLGGPCRAMEAACATGLYALSVAQLYMRAGMADAMLVVSASSIDPFFASMGFSTLQAIPAEGGKSRPLDISSGGLALGQGGVGCLIQPLSEARNGHIVVEGIGLASDGRGQHLVSPNPKGQKAAIARAYGEAQLKPGQIDWIEAHATGTSLGDATEMSVLADVFGKSGPPIGASKAGLGHWLTASGLLGVVKAVVAVEDGRVPPTPGVTAPMDPRVICAPLPWTGSAEGRPRRLAIDSFGFGGTNAHAILREPASAFSNIAFRDLPPSVGLTVLGMDAVAGQAVGLGDVIRAAPADLWAPLGPVTVDARRLRKSPVELAQLSASAPLMQAVADAALLESGIGEGGNVAVIIAVEADLSVHRLMARWRMQADLGGRIDDADLEALKSRISPATDAATFLGWIGNLLASRISQAWDFSGPNMTLSSGQKGAGHALELAELLLLAGKAEAVLVGSVGLSSLPEARELARLNVTKTATADGAAAFLVSLPNHELAAGRALPSLNVRAAVADLVAPAENDGIATPLVDLVRRLGAARAGKRAQGAAPVLPDKDGRVALSQTHGSDRVADLIPEPRLGPGGTQAFVFPFVLDADGGCEALDALEKQVASGALPGTGDLRQASIAAVTALEEAPTIARRIALVARTPKELAREIDRARDGAAQAAARKCDWSSPLGSAATGAPVGDAPVAFLYPGISLLPVGTGGDLFAQAPKTAADLARQLGGLDHGAAIDALYPARDPDPEVAEQLAEALAANPAQLLWITPILSSLACSSVTALLGRGPQFAAGHSLGEIGMMLAHGHWRADTGWQARLAEDPVLSNALSGARSAVQAHLGIADASGWTSALLMTDADRVASALTDLPAPLNTQVWISHRNTPSETIVCGLPEAVETLCAALDADRVPGPPGPVIHCPPVSEAVPGLLDLLGCLTPEQPSEAPTLLFSADPAPLAPGQPVAAGDLRRRVVEGFSQRCDAPALIERLFDAGARVFIEIGPNTGLVRWTTATLGDRPHLAAPIERRGGVPGHGIAALYARLIAHNVPVDLGRLRRLMEAECSPLTAPKALPVAIKVDPNPIRPVSKAEPAVVPAPVADPPVTATVPLPQPPAAHLDKIAAAHLAFLSGRRRDLAILRESLLPSSFIENAGPSPLYGPREVRAFADGSLADVLGEEGAWIDSLPRRIRVPAPPFMALDRVIEIERPPAGLAPARIVTEHDIPTGKGIDIDGQPPYLALDAQGILLLFSVLGYDRLLEGKRVYRWLDASLTYRGDAPRCGDTVRYDIRVNRVVEDGADLMVFADFKASVGARTVLEISNCAAGFFSDAALEQGQGLTPEVPRRHPDTEGVLPQAKTAPRGQISTEGLAALAGGDVTAVLGAAVAPGPGRLRLPPREMWMIDRVTGWDLQSGAPGLGVFEADKDLDPADWYLRAHFIDDPVFAGPCMIEGALQLLRIAALAHGLGAGLSDARFEPVAGIGLNVKFRGQVRGDRRSVFTYRLTVTGLGHAPVPWIIADVDLIHDGQITGRLSGLALQVVVGAAAARWCPGRDAAMSDGGQQVEHA